MKKEKSKVCYFKYIEREKKEIENPHREKSVYVLYFNAPYILHHRDSYGSTHTNRNNNNTHTQLKTKQRDVYQEMREQQQQQQKKLSTISLFLSLSGWKRNQVNFLKYN